GEESIIEYRCTECQSRQLASGARRLTNHRSPYRGVQPVRSNAVSNSSSSLRLMCVHAHPDDESSKGAATMARYVREGIEVLVVTCTGGERGDVLNPKMDRPEIQQNLTRVRNEEMARAREILGVRQHWLGFIDSGLPEGWLPDSGIPLPADAFDIAPTEK